MIRSTKLTTNTCSGFLFLKLAPNGLRIKNRFNVFYTLLYVRFACVGLTRLLT